MATSERGSSDPTLVRVIGVRALTLSVLNCIIGSAIFVVPATVAAELGAGGVLAYLVAGAAVVFVALCFAEAGSRVIADGGAYGFVDRAFGPWASFVVANLQWFVNGSIASAAVANALVGTLGAVAPALGVGWPRALLLAGLYAGFAAINVRGAGAGARAAAALTVVKLVPLGILLGAGLFAIEPANLAFGLPLEKEALGRSALLLVFALTGMEIALTASGEVTDPSRTVPRAAVLGVGLAVTLYIAIHQVAQGVMGPDLPGSAPVPLAETAVRVLGPPGRSLLLAGAAISMIAFFGSDVLSNPRALFAMAENGLLPGALARIHPRYRTPHVAIVAYTTLTATLAIVGSFTQLALLSAIGVLLIYLAVVLSLFRLRSRRVEADRPPLRLAGGPLIPVLALGFIAWLLAGATRAEFLAAAGFVAVVSLGYLVVRRRREAATTLG